MAGFFRNSFRKKKNRAPVSEPVHCDVKAMLKPNGVESQNHNSTSLEQGNVTTLKPASVTSLKPETVTSHKQGSDARVKSSSLNSSSSNVTLEDTIKKMPVEVDMKDYVQTARNNYSFDSDNRYDNLPFVDALRGDSPDELRFDTPTLQFAENRRASPLIKTTVQPSPKLKPKTKFVRVREASANRVTFKNGQTNGAGEISGITDVSAVSGVGDVGDKSGNSDVTGISRVNDAKSVSNVRDSISYREAAFKNSSVNDAALNVSGDEVCTSDGEFRGACVIPQTLKQSTSTSSLGLHRDGSDDLMCRVCGEKFRRPRILSCLHTFCTACIVNLQTYPVNVDERSRSPVPKTPDDLTPSCMQPSAMSAAAGTRGLSPAPCSRTSSDFSQKSGSSHRSSQSSSRSGHVSSEKSNDGSFEKNTENFSEKSRKSSSSSREGNRVVLCPICLKETKVSQTLEELPRNYVAERRIAHDVFANAGVLRLECDSCAEYNESYLVTVRCMNCAENLCSLCELSHRRQKKTKRHQLIDVIPTSASPDHFSFVLDLSAKHASNQNVASHQSANQTAASHPSANHTVASNQSPNQNSASNHATTRLAPPRAIACSHHPGENLKLFCRTCDGPVCRDCVVVDHRDHDYQFLCPELFRQQMNELQQLIRSVVPRVSAVDQQLSRVAEAQVDVRQKGGEVLGEITRYMDTYVATIQQHRQQLLQQVEAVMEEKQRALHVTDRHLRHVRFDVEQTCRFVSDMIENASDVEILSVKRLITDRLSGLKQLTGSQPQPVSSFIRFNPAEKGPVINNFQMFGRVVSRKASAAKSTLSGEGLNTARVSHESSVILRINGEDGNQYTGRDAQVKAWLIFQSQSIRSILVHLTPLKDGAYSLKFTPVQTGNHFLHVAVDTQPIKDSPFRFKVKSQWREHKGVWHCCSVCSSGGRLDVPCGCRGIMPGGYQGCCHGNPSHPGGHHWSCCGKMVQTSECSGVSRPRQSPVRQVTL